MIKKPEISGFFIELLYFSVKVEKYDFFYFIYNNKMKDKKIKVYFTMEEEKYKNFEKYTDEKFINKSKLIESLIVDYMKIIENCENSKEK